MDASTKKEALRLFTYGLYAVTCGDERERTAFTANWLSQVSFDPPLVVVSVENTSHSLPLIRRTGRFAVNIFAADERDLSGRLGKGYEKHPEKLDGIRFGSAEGGCPVLADAPAWVVCQVTGELPAGDSTLVLGHVMDARVNRRVEPLTMLAAGFKHAG
ncbi:MAG: flavin reductase [Ktedonobacterales bacterium]|nr:flavin reductase [Ktedonobacterales bacterium]